MRVKLSSASNVCIGQPNCANNIRPCKFICGIKVTGDGNIRHRDLVNTSNVLPSKPIRTNHICFVNSSLSTEQVSFIFSLSFLGFLVHYKYSTFKMNIFINLFSVKVTLLTKLT